MATRDEERADLLRRLSKSAAGVSEEISRWREEAAGEGAEAHYILYTRISDEIMDAVAHLDCAATLTDPKETDVAEFFETYRKELL